MLPKAASLLSNPSSTLPTSLKWRSQLQQSQLVSQISSLLLQHKNWLPLLQKSNLPSKITPALFLQVLHKTQNNPQVSLEFFNWAKTKAPFKPDLKSHLKILHTLLQSNLLQPTKPLFKEILIRRELVSTVLNSSLQVSKRGTDKNSLYLLLNFLFENYSKYGTFSEGLEIFRKIRVYRFVPSVFGCNALLGALLQVDKWRLMWCFYASVVRNTVVSDSVTWVLLTRAFCVEGKVEMAVKLLHSGVSSAGMYNLIIDYYSRNGAFLAAMNLINELHCKKLKPGFGTYGSILDGACKFNNDSIIDSITRDMAARELLPAILLSDCDLVIRKFCELGKTYAASMFFERAHNENIELQDVSYLCMLKALSKEGRLKEANLVYRMISEKGIMVTSDCYDTFVNLICKEEPAEGLNVVLKDVIMKGFLPDAQHLSKYLDALCCKGRWQEADVLLNVILEKRLLPDGICCRSVVEHYCAEVCFDSAIALHDKVERLGGSLDVTSYNALLEGLCTEDRIEEANRVFDCMRKRNVVSSGSYLIMINALCCAKEMRKAMKLHDEMLEKGLKPDNVTYKRLISGFA